MLRIFFVGTVMFSRRILERLLQMPVQVVGVAGGTPDGVNSDWADLSGVCQAHGISFRSFGRHDDEGLYSWVAALQPDVLFCMGWSRLLRKELLRVPPRGTIGFHPAPLPRNRGRHPLIWALALGLDRTAATFFRLDEGADSGDILSQTIIDISPEDDAGILYEKVTQCAIQQLDDLVARLIEDRLCPVPQDPALATYWRKRTRLDGLIDWRMPPEGIRNLVRALAKPYPGASFLYRGEEIKAWKVEIAALSEHGYADAEPGKVLGTDENSGAILVKCHGGVMRLVSCEPSMRPQSGEYLL